MPTSEQVPSSGDVWFFWKQPAPTKLKFSSLLFDMSLRRGSVAAPNANPCGIQETTVSGDFERELTRRVWTDEQFAAQVETDPAEALKAMGVEVPAGVKVKVVVQRRDRVYFTIPPARAPQSPLSSAVLNQMDLWSSQGLFIWLVPVGAKFKLLALRNAARAERDRS